jgi:hypothetical protein
MDTWQQHVSLEISDALGNDDRLLQITQALKQMDSAELIPEPISDALFNHITNVNEGGQ